MNKAALIAQSCIIAHREQHQTYLKTEEALC